MKWTRSDVEMYIKSREFIDTAVIPLIPISLHDDAVPICEMGEFISILSIELEREYKGRIIVLPAFTYLKQEDTESLIERINKWNSALLGDGVKHVLLLTSDSDWKLNEKDLHAGLVWLPSIALNDLDKKYIEQLMKSQLKQFQSIVMNLWKSED